MSDHMANERKETDAIKREALRLGIPIPDDPGWWYIDDEVRRAVSSEMWELISDSHEYLTQVGKSGARKPIRDELRRLQEAARKDIEWKRKDTQWKWTIAGIIMGWVLGVAGILIAIFKKH
jgi:hypothetical protein